MNDSNPVLFWLGNSASVGVIISTIVGWLPALAALIAVIWYLVQIYESKTVQRFLNDRLKQKLLHLHAEAAKLELLLSEKNDFETREAIKHLAKVRTEIDYKIGSLADKQEAQAKAKEEHDGPSGNQV